MNKSSALTSRAALLVVALCSAGAAALAGPPLPAPYRAAQTVQAGKVAVTAAHATLRVPSGVEGQDTLREITLLLAREAGTGRTLWKRYVSGLARVQEVNGDRVIVQCRKTAHVPFEAVFAPDGIGQSVTATSRAPLSG